MRGYLLHPDADGSVNFVRAPLAAPMIFWISYKNLKIYSPRTRFVLIAGLVLQSWSAGKMPHIRDSNSSRAPSAIS